LKLVASLRRTLLYLLVQFTLLVSVPVRSRPFSIMSALAARSDGGSNNNTNEDDTCNDSDSKRIGDELEQKLEVLFEKARSLPISLSRDDGNIEIRNTFEPGESGDEMVTLAEAKFVAGNPNSYKRYLENFNSAFEEVDPMVKKVHSLERDGNEREGIKVFLKFASPVSDRVMVYWKYVKLNHGVNKDEHLMMLSEKGNENLIRKYLTKEESDNNVLARTFLCAYWIKPIYEKQDDTNKIIGSNIRYVYSGNVGGYMPKRLINFLGPKTALNSLKGMIGYGEKKE